ncbi:hypothetical protein [Aphanothece stagnina]|jgi:hypothetical protein|uniref:hypothetical protein n=1 Tax=Aphanothece stagnina TaxID=1004305 RepID=UPI00398F2CBD
MNQTLDCPILGLDTDFPNRLHVVKHPPSGKFGCYCHDGVHGLACFSSEEGAFRFAEWIDLSNMASEEVSFDEAREIAKARPLPIVSLMLLDNLEDPKIHFVR